VITLTLLLSIYASIISTILLARWVRLLILKRNARRQIEKDNLSPEKQEFIGKHPPIYTEQVIKAMQEEMEGVVVRGFEAELDRMESEEVEESVEEREYREEVMINLKRGARR